MKNCNVVSLTNVNMTDIETVDVKEEKVLDAILGNHDFIKFEEVVLNDENKDQVYDIVNELTKDLIKLHKTNAPELSLDLTFDKSSYMFDITVNLIQTGMDLNTDLFNLAIEYADIYEEKIINKSVADVFTVDFNTMTKNENLQIITKYSDGRVENSGEKR